MFIELTIFSISACCWMSLFTFNIFANSFLTDSVVRNKRNNLPLILLSIDFYKASDSISTDHTKKFLEIFEFPEVFIKAYMQLARNGTVQLEINSKLSEDLKLLKGTAQGNPKS